MDFFLQNSVIIFSLSLLVTVGICIIETISMLLGTALSSVVDGFLPDFEVGIESDGSFSFFKFFGIINIGNLPFIIFMMLFCFVFGTVGIFLQKASISIIGSAIHPLAASMVSLAISIPVTRITSRYLARVLPTDETQAVSEISFIGKTAFISQGYAESGHPAQARLIDDFGQSHYIMVEPEQAGQRFEPGEEVLILLQQKNAVYTVMTTDA